MQQRLRALDAHSVVSTVDRDGNLSSVNDLMTALTGHSREALLGKPVSTLYPKSDEALAIRIRERLKTGQPWHGETPLQHADGHTIYTQTTILPLLDVKGESTGSISVRTDTTGVKQLLAEQETMELLNELRDDIWIVNSSDWKFSYTNHAARQRLGWSGDDAQNRTLDSVSRHSDFEPIALACRSLKSSADTATRFEIIHKGIPLHVSVKLVNDAKGSDFFLILLSDISDMVEQDRRKSEFVSTVSHELRSPLTSIKGALRLLLSSKAITLPQNARDLLEIAHRNSDRLILIINDILDLEKISNGEMPMEIQDVDLSELVNETRNATAMMHKLSNVTIEVSGTDIPLFMQTDPNRFIQILTDLLSNACKFSNENGRVFVNVQDNGDHVRVSVQDEGAGIPASDQHKIFQRFADMTNSDRAAKGGTGLGLSICKAIVDSLGGTIGFQTREGMGTEFYFTLPRSAQAAHVSQFTQVQTSSPERYV
ncbi:PAS domain-containing sensor histidine kinase [Roseovarius sp. S4756]|uniref:PAS domain-containing sensor histidine kinase n=1 Tax=Roseovarius maritimus TaxID=3342637 RepID=UPI00372AA2FD